MEKLNHWLALIGNLGVIAGIFFLAYEIQANTNAVRSTTYQAFNESSFSWADSEIENVAATAKIYESESLDELTAEQRLPLNRILFKAFTVMESNYLHHRAGNMDDDVFEAKSVLPLRRLYAARFGWRLSNRPQSLPIDFHKRRRS